MNEVAPSEQPFGEDTEQQLMAAYVLGDLDAVEAIAFEQLLQKKPHLRSDLTELQQSLEQFCDTEEVVPPMHLKGRTLAAFTASATTSAAGSSNGFALDPETEKAKVNSQPVIQPVIQPVMGFPRWAIGALGLAAAGLIAMLGIQNYWLRQSLYALQSAPTNSPTEALTFDLEPVEGVQSGQIEVIVDPIQLTAVVKARDLPPLAADQVYALWTVVAEDAPVTADDKGAILTAVFTVDATGNQVQKISVPGVFSDSQPAGVGDRTTPNTTPSTTPNTDLIKAVAVTVEEAAAPQRHQSSPLWIEQL